MLFYMAFLIASGAGNADSYVAPSPTERNVQCEFASGPLGLRMVCGESGACPDIRLTVGADPPARTCLIIPRP